MRLIQTTIVLTHCNAVHVTLVRLCVVPIEGSPRERNGDANRLVVFFVGTRSVKLVVNGVHRGYDVRDRRDVPVTEEEGGGLEWLIDSTMRQRSKNKNKIRIKLDNLP